MRKKIVAGNWKMNKNLQESKNFLQELTEKYRHDDSVEVLVFPSFVALDAANKLLQGSGIGLGAQNCHDQDSGAFTGEVSAEMLLSAGCKYVLVGHSERRSIFNEDYSFLENKTKSVLKEGMTPVFCIGEKLEERESDQHFNTVEKQLQSSLFSLSKAEFSKLVLAYEPVWAIGTGKTATSEQVQEMHSFIREKVADKYGKDTAESIRILYGGSCKASNASELFSNKDVDGGLIGGASLKVDDFQSLIEIARK